MAESNQEMYSEPPWVTEENRLKQTFYRANVDKKIVPKTRNLLRTYSNISEDAISRHVHEIRDKAWETQPYPCIGTGAYLVPQLSQLPVYPEMLQRLTDGELLIDVGCFIGHDLRHIVHDGAPSANIYGLDIANFWDLGYEMFRDSKHFNARFIEADMLSSGGSLEALSGRCGIICISQVLHQWNWNGQVQAAKALCRLSAPGSMIVGNQIGNSTAQELTLKSLPRPIWRHNASSFAQLWEEVGLATNTRWECSSWMKSFTDIGWTEEDGAWMEEGAQVIEFAVRRLS